MAGLRKGMMGLVGLVFLLLLYNFLTNRPLRTASNAAQIEVSKALQKKLWGVPQEVLQPCWSLPPRKGNRKEWGYILVTCSHGLHYHRAQIATAVVVAQQLGATLVMPTIKESAKEPGSNFDDIYNVKQFIGTLEGVVRVLGRLPQDLRIANHTTIEVPYSITKTYIEETVHPILKKSTVIVLENFSPESKAVKQEQIEDIEAIRCLVIHQSLVFLSQIEKLGIRLKNRMREAAQSNGGHFVAVDYRTDLLSRKPCDQGSDSLQLKKRCLSPHDLGLLLQSYGFPPETAIYLTQSRLDESLNPLLSLFPNVITKEYSMPFNEENQFLFTGKSQLELAVDFFVCSQSDVFVSVIPGAFYAAVAGERIKLGLTHMLVPTLKSPVASSKPVLSLKVSEVVTQKNHPVYSCFCEQGVSANKRSKALKGSGPSLQESEQEGSLVSTGS